MKTPQLSTINAKVELLCQNMETSNKKVTDTNFCAEEEDDVKEGHKKYPVENDEKDCENANNSKSMGKQLLQSSDLPTDVETDDAASEFVQIHVPPPSQDRSADNLTSLLDNLNISPVKSKVEDVQLTKMTIQKPVDEQSCDKAAKDLLNLLTTLRIGKPNQKATKENDKALSVLQQIDETLAKIGKSEEVKDEANKKMKSRGFGELLDSMSDDATLQDLQPGDLEEYFKRENIRPETEPLNRIPNSTGTLPSFHEQFVLRNNHVSQPPTTSYSSIPSGMGSVTNPPSLGMYQTGLHTLNNTIGVPGPFLPDQSNNSFAKRTKFDSGFEYPFPQYPPSDNTHSFSNMVNPFSAQENLYSSQPPPTYPSVSSQNCPTVTSVLSTMHVPYQPPNGHFSTVHSPSYSSSSSHSYCPSASSYSSDVPGSALSPCPSSQFCTSPRSQNSSSPTLPNYFSPDSSDSGIGLYDPCNPPTFSNVGSPASTSSFISTQPYVPVTESMTAPRQHIQGGSACENLPRDGLARMPNALHFTSDAGFDYTDEDGDCIVHILLLVYGHLLNTGRDSKAHIFLNYVSKDLLPNPMIKTKLNYQNYKLQTPLYLAVKHNLLPMVDLLIQSGADVNIQGRGHEDWVKVPQTDAPLHVAASMGDRGLNLVKIFLRSRDTEVNIKNTEGETPLHVAAKEHGMMCTGTTGVITHKNCINVVKCLLEEGADMEAKEYKFGKTALMFAIESKDVKLVKIMLEKCDSHLWHSFLNESTNDLNTCMHLAFGLNKINESKHVELIRLLIKRGGEAEAENSSNQKAKDFAPNVYSKALTIWK